MKYIAIVLGTLFLLASCTQAPEQNGEETPSQPLDNSGTVSQEQSLEEETLDEATLKALNDPVKPDPDKPIGVSFGEPENVVEVTKPEVSAETRALINENLVGKWVTPGNESKNLQINDDDTFVFKITKEDIPLTGVFQ